MMHRRRRRRGSRGRIPNPVYVHHKPVAEAFIPQPFESGPPIILEVEEVEVMRLIDLLDLSQEEAGMRMGISRGTIWRLLQRARKKLVEALVEGRKIQIAHENVDYMRTPGQED
jgi:predicted DNA-binding protein (UPF0251 family)